MTRKRRSLARDFARDVIWIAIVLVVFLAFYGLDGPRILGEWFAQFYTPGR